MRNYAMIFCSVLLMTMVFSPGCTTQDTGYPDSATAPQVVKGNPPVTTPAPPFVNVHLPLAAPTQQVVYVTVTVTGPGADTGYGTGPCPHFSRNRMHR